MSATVIGSVAAPLAIGIISLVAAVVQRATGSGYGIVAAPLLVLVDPRAVPGPLLVATVVVMSIMVVRHRASLDARCLVPLIAALPVGVVGGALLALVVPAPVGQMIIASGVLVAVAAGFAGWVAPYTRLTGAIAGGAAGVFTVLAGLPGPPVTLVYPASDPERTRASLSLFFLIASILSLMPLAFAPASWLPVSEIVAMSIGAVAGLVAARGLLRFVDARRIRLLSLVLCAIAGLTLLVRTLV